MGFSLLVAALLPAQAPAPKLDFLVVAPRPFAAQLAPYLAARAAMMSTEFLALEDALASGPGVDQPERLKRRLFALWRERGLRYVLLVGDADILPLRYMVLDRVTAPAFDYAFYPSDLYYADLAETDGSFEDWNAAKDDFHAGYFGEVRGEKNKDGRIDHDQVDYRPEIGVGRWPVSNEEALRHVIAKTLAWDKATPTRRAAFCAVDGWIDARPFLDEQAKKLPEAWRKDRLFYGGLTPPTEPAVLERVNDGFDLVCHTGHGSDMVWEHCLSAGAIPQMKNAARPTVFFSVGCSTARFATLPPYEAYVDIDGHAHAGTNAGEIFRAPPPPPAPIQSGPAGNPSGLGELLLTKGESGGAAYIGCNTGSQPCALSLLEGFMSALAEEEKAGRPARLGDCWAAAIRHYHAKERLAELAPNPDWYPPSIFFQGMKFMLFGDPTLPLLR